jgi:hypothetical protein
LCRYILVDGEWRGRRPPPKVYVYNLPPEFNVHFDARKLGASPAT